MLEAHREAMKLVNSGAYLARDMVSQPQASHVAAHPRMSLASVRRYVRAPLLFLRAGEFLHHLGEIEARRRLPDRELFEALKPPRDQGL